MPTRYLAEKRIFVIPDILANAGGVTTSYFEWVQDRMGYFWTEAEVNQRLDAIMIGELRGRDCVCARRTAVNNRIAAYMLAIDRVAYTTKQRGCTPSSFLSVSCLFLSVLGKNGVSLLFSSVGE